MKNKRIFYSIDVECTEEDLFNFVQLNNPKGFQYEYVEDIVKIGNVATVSKDLYFISFNRRDT